MKSNLFSRLPAALLLLQLSSLSLFADELLSDGSFETPVVEARTPKAKGGDPTEKGESPVWSGFDHKPDAKGGTISAGITNEIAHSGKQALFIAFDKVGLPYQNTTIQTKPIPIVPLKDYRLAIWGKLDPKNPLGAAGRTAVIKVQVDFFKADKETQVGESTYAVAPIPGTKGRPTSFTDQKWTEFWTEATAPEDGVFMIVTWRWETSAEPGEANGAVYFDDASVQGPAAPVPVEPKSAETKPDETKPSAPKPEGK